MIINSTNIMKTNYGITS